MTVKLNYIVNIVSNFWNKGLAFFEIDKHTIKTHNYTQYEKGKDYFFDPAEKEKEAYMTGQRTNIKPGDYLIISNNSKLVKYQVRKIEYYSNSSDIWMALLREVSNNN